jgi:hypothetical protein
MNSILKSIILILAVNLIFTQDIGVLFDLNEMYSQGTLQTFLGLQDAGYPVTITDCMENPVFKITQKVVDPPSMIKGQSIKIKAGGVMMQDVVVQKLHLDTFFNSKVIYTADVDKKNVEVKKGKWAFDYEASVPTFTPSGHWEIFIYIVSKDNTNLNCLKATFDTN